jgi:hypothetical protein
MFKDLGARIKKLIGQGEEIILMIDANESLSDSRSKFTGWTNANKLVDILVQQHGTEGEPATYAGGSKRIDYIMMTPKIAEFVEAAGILELKAYSDSDHRALYADIDMAAFLGGKPSPLENSTLRGISSGDPRAVKQYTEALEKELRESRIEERMAEVLTNIENNGGVASEAHRASMEELEESFSEARIKSEKKCKHIRSHPWSPTLRSAREDVRYWKLWVSQYKLEMDFTQQRVEISEQAHERETTVHKDMTVEKAKVGLREAKRTLKQATINAKKTRFDYLHESAAAATQEGKQEEAKAMRRILKAEQSRESWMRLRRVMGKATKSGLTHIMVEDGHGNLESISDKEAMFEKIIERNKVHFAQADGTPFTTAPIIDYLGRLGTNEASEMLLRGQAEVDEWDINEPAKVILREMKRVTKKDAVSDYISAEDLDTGYGKWGEGTSTSPSGLHLGHDKTILKTNKEAKDESGKQVRTLRQRYFELKAAFINFAIRHCHVFKRWKTVVNATIEKIPGKPLLQKLRIIHLIESDFNLMIGILWGRRLMAHMEKTGALGEEQGGSRAGRMAQHVLLLKQAIYSIWRLSRTNGASFDNDAKSCYDRIVMLLASLVSQRGGMTKEACNIFLETLDQMKYHVKTALGISDEFYTTTETRNVHGPGQGGRGSPSIWVTINWAGWTIIQRNMGIRERKYAIKLTTEWLPTGTKLEKYGNLVTGCHKCGGRETCNHIVQCPAKATEKLITIRNLDKMLKTIKTTDDVRHALVAGVELWIHGQKVKESVAVSKRTAKAIRIQNTIGWDMAMRGRLANEWAVIQEHNGDGVPRGRMSNRLGDSWSAQVGSFLIQESRRFWTMRNNERQKSSSIDEPDRPRAVVEAETRVKSLYNRENELAQRDRKIFDLPLAKRLELPVKHQELWYERTLPMVNRLAREEQERLKKNNTDIRTLWAKVAGELKERNKGKESQGRTDIDTSAARVGGAETNRAEDLTKNVRGENLNHKRAKLDRFMAYGARQHAAREKATAAKTSQCKHKEATDHAVTAQQEGAKARGQNERNCESSKRTSASTTSHCVATTITGGNDNDRYAQGKTRSIDKDRRATSRRRRSVLTGVKQSSTRTAANQSSGCQGMENQECPRAKTTETTQKRKNEGKADEIKKNPYSKEKARGAKGNEEDVQKKETSNSARTVLERWVGARKPKFKEKRQSTDSAEQESNTKRTQVGILQFFKGKTGKLP